MARVDYYHDPSAPRANSLVVGSSAIVVDDRSRLLLQRRSDSGNWALPGGVMEIGETLAQSLIREVREESGLEVAVRRIVGVYSDPGHVFAYDDGEVRQEFSICIACEIAGGSLRISAESTQIGFFGFDDLAGMQIHESVRTRIRDFLDDRPPVLR